MDVRAQAASQLGQFSPGEVLSGKYRIQAFVGDGGAALFLAATHLGLDGGVSIKVLKREHARDPDVVARFLAEARVRFTLDNEHMARVLDVATLEDGVPFVVMELLEGRDLRSILQAEGDLPIERAVDLALQVCEALAAAHASQIIVRDIRPENLFVTDAVAGEHVKLFDLSFSEVGSSRDRSTTHKTRTTSGGVGTLAYTAPEQMRGSNRLDARADQWSLGCVLYELLTGHSPFERASPMQTCAAIIEDEPQRLRARCPGASAELEVALERCLRKDPTERYADIAKFALAIAPFGARSVESAHRSVELLAAPERRSRPGDRRSDPVSPPAPDPKRPIDREESGFIALTEEDLAGLEELEPVERSTPRKRRRVLLAFAVLTALSSSYLAAQGWNAAHSRRARVSIRHPADESPVTRPVPQTDRVENPSDLKHAQPPTTAPLAATANPASPTPIATPKLSTPKPKQRQTRNASEEPDVGF